MTNWLIAWMNFGLLIWIVVRYSRTPIHTYLEQRRVQWSHDFQQGKRALVVARHEHEVAALKLEKSAQEMEAFCQNMLTEAQKKRELTWMQVNDQAEQSIHSSKMTAAQMLERFKQQLFLELTQKSCDQVPSLFHENASESEHSHWIKRFVEEVETIT